MRKRNCDKLFDNIFWYIVYLLPIFGYLIYLSSFGSNPSIVSEGGAVNNATVVSFSSYMSYSGFHLATSNIIFNTFNSMFGNGGVLPLLGSPAISFLAYFVSVFIFHLFVDFILFIPRLAHKWLNTAYQGD